MTLREYSFTRNRAARRPSAFTLLEVLLALSILAAILTGFSMMVFGLAESWRATERERLLAHHAHAVTQHVEDMLRRAVRTSAASGAQSAAVQPASVRVPDGGEELLLTFELADGDRLLPWPEYPLPDVVCSLANHREEGLVLYWQSRTEIDFGDQPPRRLVLSPLGRLTGFDYYNEELNSWKLEPELVKPVTGDVPVPGRIHLSFGNEIRSIATSLNLPQAAEGLPAH